MGEERRANPFEDLEVLFHEPSRLAILSALAAATDGLSFVEIREKCSLTEGNLSRHLTTLQEARLVRIKKSFVGKRPRTTAFLTDEGRRRFVDYLKVLENALREAVKGFSRSEVKDFHLPGKTAEA